MMTPQDVARIARAAGWDVVALQQLDETVLLCWRAYDGFKLVQVVARQGGWPSLFRNAHTMPVTTVVSEAEAAIIFGTALSIEEQVAP